MSCHSTSGGIVSTSLARAVTGLTEKEVQHIFHALKRESAGMAAPSELDVQEWRSRQYDLLSRMRRMSDSRRDRLRDRLFRSRSESIPDGATFYAWANVEARARQEATLRDIPTAVDLEPPGSQAHLYDIGEDGRPKKVWYASYGSNLHSDRLMNYIQGGSPEGSTRVYEGCNDKTPPEADIPIRFAGARPHFALTSRVWRGGIAFIDAQKGESAQALGRAYLVSSDQFDGVISQENGGSGKHAQPVPLDEVLATGRSVIGNGSYETMLHIGDYEGAPVITFTAPFSTREALTRTGHILRTPPGAASPVRMPVMTNKPSPAYLRMIGGGLNEAFGMDEVQQADYLRGCPGGNRWTRQQMVRILRGKEPDPPREPDPDYRPTGTSTGTTSAIGTGKGTGKGTPKSTKGGKGGQSKDSKDTGALAVSFSSGPGPDTTTVTSRTTPTAAPPATVTTQTEATDAYGRRIPKVKTYSSVEDQELGLGRWRHEHGQAKSDLRRARRELESARQTGSDAYAERLRGLVAKLEADEKVYAERIAVAKAQTPSRYYPPDLGGYRRDRRENDVRDSRVRAERNLAEAQSQLDRATSQGDKSAIQKARRKVRRNERAIADADARLAELRDADDSEAAAPQSRSESPSTKKPSKQNGSKASKKKNKKAKQATTQAANRSASTEPASTGSGPVILPRNRNGRSTLPGVRTYRSVEEQRHGVARWKSTLDQHIATRNSIHAVAQRMNKELRDGERDGLDPKRLEATRRNLRDADARLARADQMVAEAGARLNRARSQQPARFYTPQNRTLAEWREEDERLIHQQRATEATRDRMRQELRTNTEATPAERDKTKRHLARLDEQITEYEARLKETHSIITNLLSENG